MRPLGRFEEEPEEEPAAPLASIRDERDLRFTGEEEDATRAAPGELWRVLGAEPLATGEAAAACTSPCSAVTSPFCCACCLARAAAAADPGGGTTGILDPAAEVEGDAGVIGLLRDILLRWLAQAPVMERFILARESSDTSSD